MNSTLKFSTITMPAADLGEPSPLPDINKGTDLHARANYDDSLSAEETKYMGYGTIKGVLPYTMQNNYNREKRDKTFNTVVLENDYLKATFIPEFGGRLWSLFDKTAGKELLYVNPVFQPANLALRNAWISGGVEWNVGMIGHTPYTLSPLFVSTFELEDGTPVLRMYEWERIRQVSYEIDVFLPEDSKFLFVRVNLKNTKNKEVPVYWWSNIAVPEAEDVRVISPADSTFCFDYTSVSKKAFPMNEGIDRSYTTRVKDSLDMFFSINKNQYKWITAVDKTGYGLVQSSTDKLKGRKIFLWGNGSGGKHWQEFLSVPNHSYIEIQAGLCNTQLEHMPMPALGEFQWLEAYGAMSVDPKKAHSENWGQSCEAVGKELNTHLSKAALDDILKNFNKSIIGIVPTIKSNGSGWAALENKRLERLGESLQDELSYSADSLGDDQKFWLTLLETGKAPTLSVLSPPSPFLTQEEWIPILEAAIDSGEKDWHSYLQLGVMYCAKNQTEKAYELFGKSLESSENPWALCNMGMIQLLNENNEEAAALLFRAVRINPQANIAAECAKALYLAGEYDKFDEFLELLPKEISSTGRVQLMRIFCLIMQGNYDLAKTLLDSFVLVDVRESEVALSDAWILLHKKILMEKEGLSEGKELDDLVASRYPVPYHLDFRMIGQKGFLKKRTKGAY